MIKILKYFVFSEAVISGWGYTEDTKDLEPRPMTSDVLREAQVYILPQDLCIKYSPFPISDKVLHLKTNFHLH